MFLIKKTIFIFFLAIISSCTLPSFSITNPISDINVSIDAPNDRYNMLLKKYLKRDFHNTKNLIPQFILKARISYNSTQTLAVAGSDEINSTRATVEYSLIDANTNLLIKSGSITTFPALSGSSSSLYINEKSNELIKERLSQSSAKKLYMLIKIALRKLN